MSLRDQNIEKLRIMRYIDFETFLFLEVTLLLLEPREGMTSRPPAASWLAMSMTERKDRKDSNRDLAKFKLSNYWNR